MSTESTDGPPEIIGDKKTLLYQLLEDANADELLPEWEIGVQEAGHPDEWDHYHVRAATEEEAHRRARDEAWSDFDDPMVHNTFGPYPPDRPAHMTAGELWELANSHLEELSEQ